MKSRLLALWRGAVHFLKDVADPLSKWATIVAVFFGGIWAYYNFWITDTTAANLQMQIAFETLHLPGGDKRGENSRLVVVHVKAKNIGKVPVDVEPDGETLTVSKVPNNLPDGLIDTKKIDGGYKVSMLEKYDDSEIYEPGVSTTIQPFSFCRPDRIIWRLHE